MADGSARQNGGHTKAMAIAANGISGILGRLACSTGLFAFKGERSELDPRRYIPLEIEIFIRLPWLGQSDTANFT